MRSIRVRYLVARPQKSATLYYWIPTPKLRAAGFMARRLAEPTNDLADAIRQAETLNAELDAWYQGVTPPPKHRPDSLHSLHALFQSDDGFRALKPRSQRDFLYCIKPALAWAGDLPPSAITRKALRVWYRGLRDAVGASGSRNAVAALRRLLSFALDEGWIAINPALKMRLTTPTSRARVWTLAERDSFVAAALAQQRPSMALAVMLGWCLGQRPADLRTLAWSAYDGTSVTLRQAKTGTPVHIPVLPELRRLLDATTRTSTQMVVSEATGRPYAESAFQHLFANIRSAADLPADLQFRDLRRTLATALGAAGCTDDQIRAITGHRTRSVVAIYVRPDRTYGEGAMKRLQSAQKPGKMARARGTN